MNMKTSESITVVSTSHHRNGISGDPFDVHLFKDDGKLMLGVDFGNSAFAALEVSKLAAGDIAFGSNSWRGDCYADEVRRQSKKMEQAVKGPCLFVRRALPNAKAN